MLTFDVGDKVLVAVDFTNAAGDAVDPSTVTLKVYGPTGGATSYTPTHAGTGHWEYSYTIPAPGRYAAKFEGIGNSVDQVEWTPFQARDSLSEVMGYAYPLGVSTFDGVE